MAVVGMFFCSGVVIGVLIGVAYMVHIGGRPD